MWSIALVAILTIGLTTWIVIASTNASLQQGLSSYGNGIASYMFVYDASSKDTYHQFLVPMNLTDRILEIPGVEEVYPVLYNLTTFLDLKQSVLLTNGTYANVTINMIVKSAIIGGRLGYPIELVSLSTGKLPGREENGFLVNGPISIVTLNVSAQTNKKSVGGVFLFGSHSVVFRVVLKFHKSKFFHQ